MSLCRIQPMVIHTVQVWHRIASELHIGILCLPSKCGSGRHDDACFCGTTSHQGTSRVLAGPAGAAAITGKPLARIEVHGKQLFYFFGEDPASQVTSCFTS